MSVSADRDFSSHSLVQWELLPRLFLPADNHLQPLWRVSLSSPPPPALNLRSNCYAVFARSLQPMAL